MKVLYSNPAAEQEQIWLPYTWGRFREYCDHQYLNDLSAIEWLDPIYFGWFDIEKLIHNIDFSAIDVLLCSFYVWNEKRQIEIATIAREKNPNILILGGGPQVQYRPHQNTKIYEVFDFVTPWEGEEVIADVLYKKLNNIDITETDLLVDPRNPRDIIKPKRLKLSNFKSPFLLYKEDYKRFAYNIKAESAVSNYVSTMWETNRGCPYKCSFCDWGSATADKIRRFNHETVLKEIELFSELKLDYIFNADANFGIFKEDLEYVEKMVQLKQLTGYPKELQFSAAKNKKEISNKAHKLLYDNGMCMGAQISFQHTDSEVLEAIDRSNIKQDKLQEELEEAFRNNIPLVGVVILGNPNDTLQKWKENMGHMLEIGFHNDLRVHDFMLLPNAPAAEPEYVKKYNIKTASRQNYNSGFKSLYESEFVVSTNTYDKDDYAAMQVFSYFVIGFHVLNITKFIAMFMRNYYGMPYWEFYNNISKIGTIKKIYEEVHEHMKKYTYGGIISKHMFYRNKPLNADSYFKALAVENIDEIKKDLINFLMCFTDLEENKIIDCVNTQLLTIVSWKKPKETTIKYNFNTIFKMFNEATPLSKPNWIDIEECVKSIKVDNFIVGDQLKVDISDMNDPDAWLMHKANKNANRRQGFFHYQQVLDS